MVLCFKFVLLLYFLNNVCVLGMFEGMVKFVDANFNILVEVYSYSMKKLFVNFEGLFVICKVIC